MVPSTPWTCEGAGSRVQLPKKTVFSGVTSTPSLFLTSFKYFEDTYVLSFLRTIDFPFSNIFIRKVPLKVHRKLVFLLLFLLHFFHSEENSEPECLRHIAALLVHSCLQLIHYMLSVQLGYRKWFRSIYLNKLISRAPQKALAIII